MNIVIISHYAGYPEIGGHLKYHGVARTLVERKHCVTIVACGMHHQLRWRQANIFSRPRRCVRDGVHYVFIGAMAYHGNGAMKALNLLWFGARAALLSKRLLAAQPDVVVLSSPPPCALLLALRLARRSGTVFLYELRDLWPLSLIELGQINRKHPFARFLAWCDGVALRRCKAILSPLPGIQLYLEERRRLPCSIAVVPQIVEAVSYDEHLTPETVEMLSRVPLGKFRVGYVGQLSLSNHLHHLLDAAKIARVAAADVQFVLVGAGALEAALVERVRLEGLENVTVLPAVPHKQVLPLLRAFDILYKGTPSSSLCRYGVAPLKMPEYILSGRAILHAIAADTQVAPSYGAQIRVSASDPGHMVAEIKRYRTGDQSSMARAAAEGVSRMLREASPERFVDMLLDVVGR